MQRVALKARSVLFEADERESGNGLLQYVGSCTYHSNLEIKSMVSGAENTTYTKHYPKTN